MKLELKKIKTRSDMTEKKKVKKDIIIGSLIKPKNQKHKECKKKKNQLNNHQKRIKIAFLKYLKNGLRNMTENRE